MADRDEVKRMLHNDHPLSRKVTELAFSDQSEPTSFDVALLLSGNALLVMGMSEPAYILAKLAYWMFENPEQADKIWKDCGL